jgi:hypothetical protein
MLKKKLILNKQLLALSNIIKKQCLSLLLVEKKLIGFKAMQFFKKEAFLG